MKILSGKLKGRNFYMPKGVRPTQDVVRKAICDFLGQDLTGITFLELFAGSGAMGLEAISRGAKEVIFVERERLCLKTIQENITLLNSRISKDLSFTCDVLAEDALMAIKHLAYDKRKFDIIFVDPPYGLELAKKTLKTLEAYDIVHADSFVIIQHDKHETLPETQGRFLVIRQRNYGSTVVTVYKIQR